MRRYGHFQVIGCTASGLSFPVIPWAMSRCYMVITLYRSEPFDLVRTAQIDCYSDVAVFINSVDATTFYYNDVAIFMLQCTARSHPLAFDPAAATQYYDTV